MSAQDPQPTGYVLFVAAVDPESSGSLLRAVMGAIDQGLKRVVVVMASPGGGIPAGIGLANALIAVPIDVHTHNIGNVASIANVVFSAGEHRSAGLNTRFYFHPADGSTPQQADNEARVSSLLEARPSMSAAEIADLKQTEANLTPDEAANKGIIDEIVDLVIPTGAPLWTV